MLMRLRAMMRRDEKGFTLVELIVVMAILAILAALALPRFQNIQAVSRVKVDAATAASICKAARVQEMNDGKVVDSYIGGTTPLKTAYFDTTQTPKSGGTFVLSGGGTDPYKVTWTPDDKGGPCNDEAQEVTEGVEFTIKYK
jgi:prepilin-type N-terminal cleavage/methylation domain-containing protein